MTFGADEPFIGLFGYETSVAKSLGFYKFMCRTDTEWVPDPDNPVNPDGSGGIVDPVIIVETETVTEIKKSSGTILAAIIVGSLAGVAIPVVLLIICYCRR